MSVVDVLEGLGLAHGCDSSVVLEKSTKNPKDHNSLGFKFKINYNHDIMLATCSRQMMPSIQKGF